MRKDEFQTLWAYNNWANRRILSFAARLAPAQFTAPVACSFGSFRATLVHIFGAEQIWRLRCQEGSSPAALPREADYPNLTALQSAWEEEMALMQRFLDSLDPVDSQPTITYKNTKGLQFSSPLWQIILHMVNHGTQFRSEAGMILSAWGFSPGDLDLIFYLRDQPK